MLFWALPASGQITMRKVDGWQSLPEPARQSVGRLLSLGAALQGLGRKDRFGVMLLSVIDAEVVT